MPTSAPGPFTMFRVPGGRMSPTTSMSLRIDQGVRLAGFRTVTRPITFGEIAYQLLNRTLVYLSIVDG